MFSRSFQNQKYTIRVDATTDSRSMSFDTCFEINTHDALPRSFKTVNGRTFTRTKLERYESVVDRIWCEGNVTFADLKKHIPTIFNYEIIKSLNSQSYLKENIGQVIALGSAIIGEKKTKRIMKNKHSLYTME